MVTDSESMNHLPAYECLDCGQQVRSASRPSLCERCGGDLRSLALSHE